MINNVSPTKKKSTFRYIILGNEYYYISYSDHHIMWKIRDRHKYFILTK